MSRSPQLWRSCRAPSWEGGVFSWPLTACTIMTKWKHVSIWLSWIVVTSSQFCFSYLWRKLEYHDFLDLVLPGYKSHRPVRLIPGSICKEDIDNRKSMNPETAVLYKRLICITGQTLDFFAANHNAMTDIYTLAVVHTAFQSCCHSWKQVVEHKQV